MVFKYKRVWGGKVWRTFETYYGGFRYCKNEQEIWRKMETGEIIIYNFKYEDTRVLDNTVYPHCIRKQKKSCFGALVGLE